MISKRLRYVSTGGYRGYYEPIDAVAGANNTGSWSDSPCFENTCLKELGMVKKLLRKHKITYRTMWCATSNIFSVHGYIVVPNELKEKAKKIIQENIDIENETSLLYIV